MAFHTDSSRLFPKIGQAQFAFSHVRAEVSLVSHEQNPRAILDMAVVMDVHKQVSFNGLALNPRMENRNEILHADVGRFGREEFDAESMEFHYFLPRSVRMSCPRYTASTKSCASSTRRWAWSRVLTWGGAA